MTPVSPIPLDSLILRDSNSITFIFMNVQKVGEILIWKKYNFLSHAFLLASSILLTVLEPFSFTNVLVQFSSDQLHRFFWQITGEELSTSFSRTQESNLTAIGVSGAKPKAVTSPRSATARNKRRQRRPWGAPRECRFWREWSGNSSTARPLLTSSATSSHTGE